MAKVRATFTQYRRSTALSPLDSVRRRGTAHAFDNAIAVPWFSSLAEDRYVADNFWFLALRSLLLRLRFGPQLFQPLLVEVALELAVGHDFILAKVIEK